MTNNPLPIPDERTYQDGYSDGLAAAVSIHSADLPVLSLANALDAFAKHAARMDNADETFHRGCLECETMMLLSRVVKFGTQLRDAERERL